MTKSMTEGKPLPLILQFAVPLLIGNLLQQTYTQLWSTGLREDAE